MKHGWIRWFVLYMAIGGGSYMMYHLALPVRVFHHVIITAILIFWFLKYGLPNTPMLLPAGGMILALVASALGATDKRMAFEFAWHWTVNLLLFMLLIDWFRQGRESTLFKFQFGAGAFLVGSMLMEWLLTGERPGGAMLNINLAGGYAAALVVPVLAWYYRTAVPLHKGLLLILAVGLLIVLGLNHSRGAVLSLITAVFSMSILQFRFPWLRLLGASGVGVGVAIIAVMTLQPQHLNGDYLRMDLWRVAHEIIDSRPLGVGPGLYAQAYRQSGLHDGDIFTGAHSYYLNLGAELGVVGLAAGGVFGLAFLYGLMAQRRSITQDAALAALVGICAHMLFDNFPSSNYTFLSMLYAAYVIHEWTLPNITKYLKSTSIAVAVLIGLYGFAMIRFDHAQVVYEQSLENRNPEVAYQAAQMDVGNRLYWINWWQLKEGWDYASAIDPTLTNTTNLVSYGITNFGRVFR